VHTRLGRESLLEAVGCDPSSVHELVEALRAEVETLRAELEEAHAANRENRRIIAALTQRIPELETPREQASPQGRPGLRGGRGRAGGGRGQTRPATEGVQEGAERVLWWRVFGL
jgi:hypothetical protein